MKPAVTSANLLAALAVKHTEDVFVAECKTGSSWFGMPLRLDAWAMKRSWAHWKAVGYEIKVTRADFKRDTKWPDYLWTCNEFFFVAPPGVIEPNELPAEVGLLVSSANGKRLFMKKVAAHRDIDPPTDLLIYVLMSRAVISRESLLDTPGRLEYWHTWLAQKREGQELGYEVTKRIREHVDDAKAENRQLKERIGIFEHIEQRLYELGFDSHQHISEWRVGQTLDDLKTGIPRELRKTLEHAACYIDELRRVLDRVEGCGVAKEVK